MGLLNAFLMWQYGNAISMAACMTLFEIKGDISGDCAKDDCSEEGREIDIIRRPSSLFTEQLFTTTKSQIQNFHFYKKKTLPLKIKSLKATKIMFVDRADDFY